MPEPQRWGWPEPCSRSGPFSCFREEAQRCEELSGHHGVGRAAGAAPSQQAADALSALPTAGFGRSPLL